MSMGIGKQNHWHECCVRICLESPPWQRKILQSPCRAILSLRRCSNVPQSYKGTRNLGRWVMRQRGLYLDRQKGKLSSDSTMMSDERIAKLESLNFCWNRLEHTQGIKRKREEYDDDHVDGGHHGDGGHYDSQPVGFMHHTGESGHGFGHHAGESGHGFGM